MGARWAWWARCSEGHVYSNFSGGADDCYVCDRPPVTVIDCPHWAGSNDGCDCASAIRRAEAPPPEPSARIPLGEGFTEAKERIVGAIRRSEKVTGEMMQQRIGAPEPSAASVMVPLESPDSVPPQLKDFASRDYERINRGASLDAQALAEKIIEDAFWSYKPGGQTREFRDKVVGFNRERLEALIQQHTAALTREVEYQRWRADHNYAQGERLQSVLEEERTRAKAYRDAGKLLIAAEDAVEPHENGCAYCSGPGRGCVWDGWAELEQAQAGFRAALASWSDAAGDPCGRTDPGPHDAKEDE